MIIILSLQPTNNNKIWHYIFVHLFATKNVAFKFKNTPRNNTDSFLMCPLDGMEL